MLIEEKHIVDLLDDLIPMIESDYALFVKTYRALPFDIYSEIERLSQTCQKPNKQKEINQKAKEVANAFHRHYTGKKDGRK
jgi:hypothetical protein